MHPYFAFPFKDRFISTEFDMTSGWKAKESNDPNGIFTQLIKGGDGSLEELEIYTDGFKSLDDENGNFVGCAIYIPLIDKSWLFKLNPLTSSYTAEALAIDKSLELINTYSWPHVNICSDSLSVLQVLKNSELSLFPKALTKLNIVIAELLHKITKTNSTENRVRFTWCPAHIGIENNEKVDSLAKEASIRGVL